MILPTREEVVSWGMELYGNVFILVFLVSIITVLYILSHLVPKDEY
jgi:hypothetical protein